MPAAQISDVVDPRLAAIKHHAEQWMQAYDALPPRLRAYLQEHNGPVTILWILLYRFHWSEDEVLAWAKNPTRMLVQCTTSSTNIGTGGASTI